MIGDRLFGRTNQSAYYGGGGAHMPTMTPNWVLDSNLPFDKELLSQIEYLMSISRTTFSKGTQNDERFAGFWGRHYLLMWGTYINSLMTV